MPNLEAHLQKDVQRIQSLDIVPSILELICRTTGMGFSAVARVTDDRWIACAVKDEINFGLKPGGELQLETTICNEIRGHGQPVVIDDVSNDEQFCNHLTPKMYGFRSYISIPIILKDGFFFGTLCAIDPRPFPLKAANMVTMFNLYADLISFHLLTQEQIEVKNELLQITETRLKDSLEDIRQFAHVSSHTLQEPLRKLQIFSDLIVTENSLPKDHNVKQLALKINVLAKNFSTMVEQLNTFSEVHPLSTNVEAVDLNQVLHAVINRLRFKIVERKAIVDYELLHVIPGNQQQISQLFYYILDNALGYSRPGVLPVIKIYSKEVGEEEQRELRQLSPQVSYCKVCVEDNGMGIESSYLNQIFDLFSRLNPKDKFEGVGMGLSQSKKIIRNHDGAIVVESKPGTGSVFSLIFPLSKTYTGALSLSGISAG